MYSFPDMEPVCCSLSSSNYCFLTCKQISQEAGQVIWYSHLLKNFPQFFVIHTVKHFGIVNKAEIDVFQELSCFFDDPTDVAIWSLVPLPFVNPAWTSGSSQVTYCWSLAWRIFNVSLLVYEMRAVVQFSVIKILFFLVASKDFFFLPAFFSVSNFLYLYASWVYMCF